MRCTRCYRVDFDVRAGEVMALVGDNGAGKSTLIKGIVGIYPFDEGDVDFDGKQVRIHNPRDAAALGIEVVYQDLALADNLDVVANMFLGREQVRNGVVLDELGDGAPVPQEVLESLSVTTLQSVRQTVAGLSGGQRQAVAVAKAVMWDSKMVILDEPTAALGVAQTRQVLDLVRRLAEQGFGVVHHLAQPARHLRGRRPDHGAAPGPAGRGGGPSGSDAAGGRRADHGRRAGVRAGNGRGGRL